ncbi:YtxH domain-containing protein [Streptomyces roseicoloratus]|uniref:YtxH domain-containing protein n=1 Tax=Streptomyces roseicoloratus TaxID=2508722 RepID=A0ABY9RYD5_9ACTN|nr:YtxH domain-containing protein [Streptomyces roseicoloratus]WMX47201.1 YtxH domain-containing protein [Streptomyces roseicoloratus]
MRYKLVFVAGLGLGFLIGTRAGREVYERMKKSAKQVAENPAVRNAAESAAQTGRQAAGKAFHAAGEQAQRIRARRSHNGQVAQYEDDDWGTSNT